MQALPVLPLKDIGLDGEIAGRHVCAEVLEMCESVRVCVNVSLYDACREMTCLFFMLKTEVVTAFISPSPSVFRGRLVWSTDTQTWSELYFTVFSSRLSSSPLPWS